MKKPILFLTILFFVVFNAAAQSIDHVDFSQEGKSVIINYELSGCESCNIAVFLSLDGGRTFDSKPLTAVSGDVGSKITAGKRRIVWDVFKEYPMGINADLAFMVRVTGGIILPYLSFIVKGVSFEMVYVEGGTFWMGAQKDNPSGRNYDSDAFDEEKPVHQVTLSDYYVGQTEVTQGLWEAVMGSNPSDFKTSNSDNYPVECVSWNDIQTFLSKLNSITGRTFVLPTEAQWEFAARGGTKSNGYKYSGSDNIDAVAWYRDNSGRKTHPVGMKRPNELGLYDMSGNVWEWCLDWYDDDDYYYQECLNKGTVENPQGPPSGSFRVLRGGFWIAGAVGCRVPSRLSFGPDYRGFDGGFRLALLP